MPLTDLQRARLKHYSISKNNIYDPDTGDPLDWDSLGGGGLSEAAINDLIEAYAQPLDSDLTSIAALSTTSYGRALLALADQAALVALMPRPPGYEYDVASRTSALTISAGSSASPNTVCTGASLSWDGSTSVWIEFNAPGVDSGTNQGSEQHIGVYEDGTLVADIITAATAVTHIAPGYYPVWGRVRRTPSAGTHTYSIGAWVGAGNNGTLIGSSAAPAYMTIRKI